MTRPLVQPSSTAAYGTGSGQQLESDRDVYCHPSYSTYFWKRSRQTPYKTTKTLLALEAAALLIKTKLVTNNTSDINTEINVNEAWNIHKLQVPGLTYIWSEFQAWDALQESTDNSSIDKVENSLEWQEYFSQLQETTDELSCHIQLTVSFWIMDRHSRKSET